MQTYIEAQIRYIAHMEQWLAEQHAKYNPTPVYGKCDKCDAAWWNGVYVHESGCPNMGMVLVNGEWVDQDEL